MTHHHINRVLCMIFGRIDRVEERPHGTAHRRHRFRRATTGRTFFPSPAAWEDEVLYFLMLDRFSDGRENGLPRQHRRDGHHRHDAAVSARGPRQRDHARRSIGSGGCDAGGRLAGGTLARARVEDRLSRTARRDRDLGQPGLQAGARRRRPTTATASRISSTSIRTSARATTSCRWCTPRTTHGIRVILDIILNHTGDVFGYQPQQLRCDVSTTAATSCARNPAGRRTARPTASPGYPRRARATRPCRSARSTAAHFPDAARSGRPNCRPLETFTRKGQISNWDFDPEFREGDFVRR